MIRLSVPAPTVPKETVMATTTAPVSLTVTDRCDRCGARAYMRARLASGGELLFCAHHGREHLPKLKGLATSIHDDSKSLAPKSVPRKR